MGKKTEENRQGVQRKRKSLMWKNAASGAMLLMCAAVASAAQYASDDLKSLKEALKAAYGEDKTVILSGDVMVSDDVNHITISSADLIIDGQEHSVKGRGGIPIDEPLFTLTSGPVTVSNLTFESVDVRSVEIKGTVFSISPDVKLVLSGDVRFRNNNALSTIGNNVAYGGAIYSEGALDFYSGDMHVLTLSADSNAASSNNGAALGGTFYQSGDILFHVENNIAFFNNTALTAGGDAKGGAVWASGNVTLSADAGTILISANRAVSNKGKAYGGAIYSDFGAVSVFSSGDIHVVSSDVQSTKNAQGGAVWASQDIRLNSVKGQILISGDRAASSTSAACGGALYSNRGSIFLTASKDVILANTVTSSDGLSAGGAIYSAKGGVGIYSLTGDITLENSQSFSTKNPANGGVIYASKSIMLSADKGNILISGDRAISGKSTVAGGVLYANADVSLFASKDITIENTSVFAQSTAAGGVIRASDNISLISLGNIRISGGKAVSATGSASGGALYSNAGSVTLSADSHITLLNNVASGDTTAKGASIFASKDIRIKTARALFVSGDHTLVKSGDGMGGSFYSQSGALSIDASDSATFQGITLQISNSSSISSALGGAIYASGDVVITGGETSVIKSVLTGAGGAAGGLAFYSAGGSVSLDVTGLSVGENELSSSGDVTGGLIYASKDLKMNLSGGGASLLQNNVKTSGSGVTGGLLRGASVTVLSTGSFSSGHNSVSANGDVTGGLIWGKSVEIRSDGAITFSSNSSVKTHSGDIMGGLIYSDGALKLSGGDSISLDDSTVKTDRGIAAGGGIYVAAGDAIISSDRALSLSSIVLTAPAGAYGGAIYVNEGALSVNAESLVISNDRAEAGSDNNQTARGGGAYIGSGDFRATLTDSFTLLCNAAVASADVMGGGIYVKKGSLDVSADGLASITGNSASGVNARGGAVFASGGVSISAGQNVFFGKNSASQWGGAIYSSGDVRVDVGEDLSFDGNSAGFSRDSGGAIWAGGSADLKARDILTFGTASDDVYARGNITLDSGTLRVARGVDFVAGQNFTFVAGVNSRLIAEGTVKSVDVAAMGGLFSVSADRVIVSSDAADAKVLLLVSGIQRSSGAQTAYFMQYDGELSLDMEVFDTAGYRNGSVVSQDVSGMGTGHFLALNYDACSLIWNQAVPSNQVWLLASDDVSTVEPESSEAFHLSDAVIFNGTGSSDILISGSVFPSEIRVVSGDASLAGTGSVGGVGSLLKRGHGVLTIGTENSYSGGVFLGEGTVAAKKASALGTGKISTSAGTTLIFDVDSDGILSNGADSIAGEAHLIKRGSGFLDFGSQSLSGDLTVAAGAAQFKNLSMEKESLLTISKDSTLKVAGLLNAPESCVLFSGGGLSVSTFENKLGVLTAKGGGSLSDGRLSAVSISGGSMTFENLCLTLRSAESVLKDVTLLGNVNISGGGLSVSTLTGGGLVLQDSCLTLCGTGFLSDLTVVGDVGVSDGALTLNTVNGNRLRLVGSRLTLLGGKSSLESLTGTGSLTLKGGSSLLISGTDRKNSVKGLTLEEGSSLSLASKSGFENLEKLTILSGTSINFDVSKCGGMGDPAFFSGVDGATVSVKSGAKLSLNGVKLDGIYSVLEGFNGTFDVGVNVWFDKDLLLEALDPNSPLLRAQIYAKDSAAGLYQIQIIPGITPSEIPYITEPESRLVQRLLEQGLNQKSDVWGERFIANLLDSDKVPLKGMVAQLQSVMDMAGTTGLSENSLRCMSFLTDAVHNRLQEREITGETAGDVPGKLNFMPVPERQNRGVWGSSWYVRSRVDGLASGRLKQDGLTETWGVTFGSDYTRPDSNLTTGIAFEAGKYKTSGQGLWSSSSAEGDFAGAILYTGYSGKRWFLAGDAGYLWTKTDMDAMIPSSLTTGSYATTKGLDGSVFSAGLRADWKAKQSENMTVSPFVSIRFNHYSQDGYSTLGAGGVFVDNSSTSFDQWLFPLGVRFSWRRAVAEGGWLLSPTLELAYVYAAGDLDVVNRARVPGAPWLGTTEFVTSVGDRDSFRARLRLEARKKDLIFGVEAGTQLSTNQRDFHAIASIRLDL